MYTSIRFRCILKRKCFDIPQDCVENPLAWDHLKSREADSAGKFLMIQNLYQGRWRGAEQKRPKKQIVEYLFKEMDSSDLDQSPAELKRFILVHLYVAIHFPLLLDYCKPKQLKFTWKRQPKTAQLILSLASRLISNATPVEKNPTNNVWNPQKNARHGRPIPRSSLTFISAFSWKFLLSRIACSA